VGAATGGSYQTGFGSPAVPTAYDLEMVRTSSGSTNVGTVSPQDLVVRDPSFSAPNSTAFTNLTSPSIYNVSPDFHDGYEASPMFGTNDLDPALSEPWFSLFPEEQNVQQNVDHSPLQPEEELIVSEHLRNSQHRRSGSSPGSTSAKASSTSGVAARKRNQPLPPIIVDDPADVVAVKRARNTLAARKSRQKKMERFDELESEIERLKADRDHWKSIALARTATQE